MKKVFLFSTAVCLFISSIPFAATFGDYVYTNNGDGTCIITGYLGPGGYVSIPDTLNGLTVTVIGNRAFYNESALFSVIIPDSVTTIGTQAFASTGLTGTLVIPAGVAAIGDYAFSACTGLTDITIDSDAVTIGDYAFAWCSGLTGSLIIPDSVTSIGDSAFFYCTDLTDVTIGSGVATIGNDAFYYCTGLTAITVDTLNSVYSSRDGVLFDKAQTLLIQCPAGKTGDYVIPGSVTVIRDGAFYSCSGLTGSLIIPDSVTSIGGRMFGNCTGLTCVLIGSGVEAIGDYAFYNCDGLAGVYFRGDAPGLAGLNAFYGVNAVVYYLPANAAGWPATFGGLTTALWPLSIADVDANGDVDLADFASFAAAWQSSSGDGEYNTDSDFSEPFGVIDIADLQVFVNEWLFTPCL